MLLVHGDDDQIVLYVDSAPGRSAVGPILTTCAARQVVSWYTGYDDSLCRRAVRAPKP